MDQTISEYKSIIAEQAKTIQLLTDLTRAGSWIINYAPDGSISSVQWGNGFRRLMGYTDSTDFPNELGPIFQGIYPDDREAFIAYFKNIIQQTFRKDDRSAYDKGSYCNAVFYKQ